MQNEITKPEANTNEDLFMSVVVAHQTAFIRQHRSPTEVWDWAFGIKRRTDINFMKFNWELNRFENISIKTLHELVSNKINEQAKPYIDEAK